MTNTTDKKDRASIIIDLTERGWFNGLYESVWLNSDMDVDTLEEIAEHLGISEAWDIDVSIDYQEYLENIADIYINMLYNELDDNIKVSYNSCYSPRFYNFDTNHIYLELTSETLTESEIEKALIEFENQYDDDDFYNSVEGQAYDFYNGYECYYNLVRYSYKDVEVYYNMTKEEFDKALQDKQDKA